MSFKYNSNNFSEEFLVETTVILSQINRSDIENVAQGLAKAKKNLHSRLFILGVGGSAGTASHAVNDFRKICEWSAYTPTDNMSELTARINDDGWDNCFVDWFKNDLRPTDAVLILSVGGGNIDKKISMNLVNAIDFAKKIGTPIFGIVGRDGGYTKQQADACVIIPTLVDHHITPHTEGLCGVILHLLVSHPDLKVNQTKWESTK